MKKLIVVKNTLIEWFTVNQESIFFALVECNQPANIALFEFSSVKSLNQKVLSKSKGKRLVLLENIDLALALIINIISQLIEHLNISSVFIAYINTKMHV